MQETPLSTFERQQLKLAQAHYRSERDASLNWKIIVGSSLVLLFALVWLVFYWVWFLVPLVVGTSAGIMLFVELTEKPKKQKRAASILREIEKILVKEKTGKVKISGVRALIAEPYHELQLLAVESSSGKTLLYRDGAYSMGGMLYLGEHIEIYTCEYSQEIFGTDIQSTGDPIPVNRINTTLYEDIFFELSERNFVLVPKTLEQILGEAIRRISK